MHALIELLRVLIELERALIYSLINKCVHQIFGILFIWRSIEVDKYIDSMTL